MAGARTCEVGAAGAYNILSTEVVSMKVLLVISLENIKYFFGGHVTVLFSFRLTTLVNELQ
jgi:hypothetical protein